MKSSKIVSITLSIVLFLGSCAVPKGSQDHSNTTRILQDKLGWTADTLKQGLVHYTFEGWYEPFQSNQRVDVLWVDIDQNRLVFDDTSPADSLSSMVTKFPGAIAAINGTYYEILRSAELKGQSSSFFKSDGHVKVAVTLPEGHRLFWKHEGAFYYDEAERLWGIVYGDAKSYDEMSYPNVLSGSPMLIYDHKLVGETFVKARNQPLDSLDYEDPDRHQGVRHPRTALALTNDNHLLMITVDGRREITAGMSAKELTQFIYRYFKPRYALNIDGGGSTTMWIKDSPSSNGVVNYPTDNKRYDHYGQRRIRNAIIVLDK